MEDYPGNPQQQFTAAWRTAASAFGQWREQVTAATSEAMEKIDPALRAAIEAARAVVAGNRGAPRARGRAGGGGGQGGRLPVSLRRRPPGGPERVRQQGDPDPPRQQHRHAP